MTPILAVSVLLVSASSGQPVDRFSQELAKRLVLTSSLAAKNSQNDAAKTSGNFDMPIPRRGDPTVPLFAFEMPIPRKGDPRVPTYGYDMPIPRRGDPSVPMAHAEGVPGREDLSQVRSNDVPIPRPGDPNVPMATQGSELTS